MHPTLAQEAALTSQRTVTIGSVRSPGIRRSLPLRGASLTSLAVAAPDPTLALTTAERSRPAFDESLVVAEALVDREAGRRDQVDELASGHPRVYVLDSHASHCYTRASALVSPELVRKADQR